MKIRYMDLLVAAWIIGSVLTLVGAAMYIRGRLRGER